MSHDHIPTESSRATVKSLHSHGVGHRQIAQYLDIAKATLAKHYKEELCKPLVDNNRRVAERLLYKAIEMDDLGAQIFWLKTKGGFSVKEAAELSEENETLKNELQKLRADLDSKNKAEY